MTAYGARCANCGALITSQNVGFIGVRQGPDGRPIPFCVDCDPWLNRPDSRRKPGPRALDKRITDADAGPAAQSRVMSAKCWMCGTQITSINAGVAATRPDAGGNWRHICRICAPRLHKKIPRNARCADCGVPIDWRNFGSKRQVCCCDECTNPPNAHGNLDGRITEADREWLKKLKCAW